MKDRIKILITSILANMIVTLDIVDRVFVHMENNDEIFNIYKNLCIEYTNKTTNSEISKFIKNNKNLKNIGKCTTPQSRLIESYTTF